MQLVEQISIKVSGKPASEKAIIEAENALGFPQPKLLHEIYQTVANGGFGVEKCSLCSNVFKDDTS